MVASTAVADTDSTKYLPKQTCEIRGYGSSQPHDLLILTGNDGRPTKDFGTVFCHSCRQVFHIPELVEAMR